MKIGTRSVLFGAHCWFIHPWFVAWGWQRLYGFPWDPRLWVAFFVHDLGYLGKPNMDGPEGERHVWLGARIMGFLFDDVHGGRWFKLCLRHSRFMCRHYELEPSRMCYADKLAISLTPWWLYVPMTRWTGEIREYRSVQKHRDELESPQGDHSFEADYWWFIGLQSLMIDFISGSPYESARA